MSRYMTKTHFHFNWLISLAHFTLSLLRLISYAIEFVIFQMVEWYDIYMYTPLQIYLSPYMARIPRFIHINNKTITIFNANIVTYFRTLLIIPIAWCLKYHYTILSCFLVIFHDFLDHVDGIVAKVQKRVYGENIDDPLLGGFMDAFCDKIVNIVCLWTILQETNFDETSFFISFGFILLCYTIIALETIIGIVRVQDYFSAAFNKNKILTQGSTSATMEGKLKETLESTGLAFLCLSTGHINPFHHWSGIGGIICFALTIRLACASLLIKLRARYTKEINNNLTTDSTSQTLSLSSSIQKNIRLSNEFNLSTDTISRNRAMTLP